MSGTPSPFTSPTEARAPAEELGIFDAEEVCDWGAVWPIENRDARPAARSGVTTMSDRPSPFTSPETTKAPPVKPSNSGSV